MLLPEIPEAAVWAIYLAPIASFVVISAGLRSRAVEASRLTILAIGLSWLLALWTLDTSLNIDGEAMGFASHEWVRLFDLDFSVGVRLDGLTAVMLVVVTSVSLLVQIYSTGYMHGDKGYARYFAYMSLFTAAMLGLVVSSSLLQLFVHWELVGLSSYLLIGFWFHKPSAAAAAKKAFIVTRFGDFGFMIAVLLIWTKLGTFDIAAINAAINLGTHELSSAVLVGFTLGLLAGAVGKSAQFPLHIWLPDAMEGPTPVSALIHAATMVVAGVYLIARFFPSFVAAPPEVLSTVAYIGGFTAIFAATMGIVATDIKRVLAYSTISQLGYMVMALGLGGYVAAIFHLFTHAFFKALLFLGSGSVNHATNTFDMRRMGGLRLSMPITFWTFVIGALSLSGVFPLAGFWSKDEILLDAFNHNTLLFWVGVTVAGMTAFYMFRAIFMTFFGEYRGGVEPEEPGHGADQSQPHESPQSMWVPLAILVVPAIVIGWVNIGGDFGEFVEGALPADLRDFHAEIDSFVLAVSTLFALVGIGLAAALYFYRQPDASVIRARLGPVHTLVERKYFLDELAETVVVRWVLLKGVGGAMSLIETQLIDRVVNGVAFATEQAGDGLRRAQTGQLQAYNSLFLLGVIASAVVVVGLGAGQFDRLRDWLGV